MATPGGVTLPTARPAAITPSTARSAPASHERPTRQRRPGSPAGPGAFPGTGYAPGGPAPSRSTVRMRTATAPNGHGLERSGRQQRIPCCARRLRSPSATPSFTPTFTPNGRQPNGTARPERTWVRTRGRTDTRPEPGPERPVGQRVPGPTRLSERRRISGRRPQPNWPEGQASAQHPGTRLSRNPGQTGPLMRTIRRRRATPRPASSTHLSRATGSDQVNKPQPDGC